jgi:hypothetical protein
VNGVSVADKQRISLKDFAKTQDAMDAERRMLAQYKAQVAVITKERDKLLQQLSLIEAVKGFTIRQPDWAKPSKKKSIDNRATLCVLVTDTHFDEEVDPREVDGINCYNREIAEMRLQRCFENTIMLARHYLSGVKYDGVSVMLGGDIFSGNIHEELARTNADTLFGSLIHWLPRMTTSIGMLADEFGKVIVSGTPGNHGRMTRKPIAKKRAADNLDWLLYKLMARELASDKRIEWNIPDSADTRIEIYDTTYLLTHGDQFRGGSGIAGALSPLLLGSHRKTRREMAAGRSYDYMVMGHFHQDLWLPARGVLAGNCMKGFDEYAFVCNFEPTPPSQALWITTPEHGVTFSAPIFVSDRKAEGW